MENNEVLEAIEKIASIIKDQGEISNNTFQSQMEVMAKFVSIINRQIDIIEKHHEDNMKLAQKLIESNNDK